MKIDHIQIAKLQLRPDDVVVVKINEPLTQGNADHAREYISRSLPKGTKILILDDKATLSVVEPAPAKPQQQSLALPRRSKSR